MTIFSDAASPRHCSSPGPGDPPRAAAPRSVLVGAQEPAAFDRATPVLMIRIGRYPQHHGTVGAIRSLGRVGVPVSAIVEDRFTPASRSRYLSRGFVWPTSGNEPAEGLVPGLTTIAKALREQWGRRAIAVATDDRAATLLAHHAGSLSENLTFPQVPPALPAALASKIGLAELCWSHDVPTPATLAPTSEAELLAFAATYGFPLALKPTDPWRHPAGVGAATIVPTPAALDRLVSGWPTFPLLLAQEYVPDPVSEDWIVQGYFDGNSRCLVGFTGIKIRSWPPLAGVTTLAYSTPNDKLLEMATTFCRDIGYRGIVDLDWRLDRRDGRYHLLDFNPRVGAQFRLFETDAGIDVVRAMHLDLTGRAVPAGRQVDGRRLIVENLDAAALVACRRRGSGHQARNPARYRAQATELAWLTRDDPLPAAILGARFIVPGLVRRAARTLLARPRGADGQNR